MTSLIRDAAVNMRGKIRTGKGLSFFILGVPKPRAELSTFFLLFFFSFNHDMIETLMKLSLAKIENKSGDDLFNSFVNIFSDWFQESRVFIVLLFSYILFYNPRQTACRSWSSQTSGNSVPLAKNCKIFIAYPSYMQFAFIQLIRRAMCSSLRVLGWFSCL